MEVIMQHANKEMELKIPLIDHYKEEEEEEAMEETLVGRQARRPNNDANGTTSDEKDGYLSSQICENSDKSEVEECVIENGSSNSVYFDDKEGASMEWSGVGKNLKDADLGAGPKDVDVQKVLSAVINGTTGADLKGEILSGLRLPSPRQEDGASSRQQTQSGTQNLQVDIVDEIEEEVIELEFERAVEKMHTHEYEMSCPNCSNRITKVVLRRKIVRIPTPSDTQPANKPLNLFGCLSCFRIFIAAGNKLNPFRIFGRGEGSEKLPLSQQQQKSDALSSMSGTGSTVQQQHVSNVTSSITSSTQIKGKYFDLSSISGKRIVKGNDLNVQPSSVPATDTTTTQGSTATKVANAVAIAKNHFQTSSLQGSTLDRPVVNDNSGEYGVNDTAPHGKAVLGPTASKVTAATAAAIAGKSKLDGDVFIDISQNLDGVGGMKHPATQVHEIKREFDVIANQQTESVQTDILKITNSIAVNEVPGIVTEVPSSRSVDIVKAIVYGGLMESIASLSVVSSGAASGVTTLNIVALGLANLVSGLVVLGHNLWDLKSDEFSQSDEAVKRYKELLGRREHFLLHVAVAILSYLVFGIVPLVTYGFTFRESDDRDYKLLAVAGASMLCIIILAIMKAYTRGQHKFSAYFNSVVYYVTSAVMVSGVAYAVGHLANKLLERLGWWDAGPVKAILFPETKSINAALASY